MTTLQAVATQIAGEAFALAKTNALTVSATYRRSARSGPGYDPTITPSDTAVDLVPAGGSRGVAVLGDTSRPDHRYLLRQAQFPGPPEPGDRVVVGTRRYAVADYQDLAGVVWLLELRVDHGG